MRNKAGTILLLLGFLLCCGFVLRGGTVVAVTTTTILLPLTGKSINSTNSGTLSFANSQGRPGWDVKSNGSPINLEAVSICNAAVISGVLTCTPSGTNTYFKYNTLLPSPWPATQCLVDSMSATTTLTAPTGTVTNHDGTWTWGTPASGGDYPLLLNGTQVASGKSLILASDDSIYVEHTAGLLWYGYYTATGAIVAFGTSAPTTPAAGVFRKTLLCPAGL